MKANRIFLALFAVATPSAFSQIVAEKVMHFKVIADSATAEGINVINLVTEKTAVTDKNGNFSIMAKVDDMLVLTAVNFEYRRKIIDEDDFQSDVVLIKMVSKVTQLEEVIINEYSHINPESLGIVQKGQKTHTPAERKLQTAGDFKPIHLLNLLGGSLPTDPIINAITGRTSELKAQLEIERKEMLLERLKERFDTAYYTETLKIAEDRIDGFQFYVIEDPAFAQAVEDKNNTMLLFVMSRCASEYNELLASEKN